VDDSSCLVIRAPFLPAPVITHDVAEITGKHEFIWKGRLDNLINTGGIKINPEQLEKEIFNILSYESYVVGIPDEKFGQRMLLATLQEFLPQEKKNILESMKEKLPAYHIPADIITVRSFPRNTSLKIDRTALRAMVMEKIKKY